VTLLLPIWPAIFTPFHVRAASTEPTEPGWRMLCEPWVTGPRPKRWRLTTPAKPLPLEVPLTATLSPSANTSAFSSAPTSTPSPGSPRNSTIRREGLTPAFLNSPAAGLVTFFSLIAPKPRRVAE
jgi:hypothetical protein